MSGTILLKTPNGPSAEDVKAAALGWTVVEADQLPTSPTRFVGGVPSTDIEVVLGASPVDHFAALPNLRWAHSSTAGVDEWLRAANLPDHVVLTSSAGNGAIPLAEHALMLMLMLNRNAKRWLQAQQRREWDRFTHGELAGSTLGVIGYGNSGRDLARKGLACHMKVQAVRRTRTDTSERGVKLLHGHAGLKQLLRTSDFVVVTVPLTSETEGLLGAAELARMKQGAHVVVFSRGGIIDEDALIRALQNGHLGGAGLDCFEKEPLSPDSPLWDMPNVIITPHNSATTEQTVERGRQILLENVSRWVGEKPLLNVVEPRRGY